METTHRLDKHDITTLFHHSHIIGTMKNIIRHLMSLLTDTNLDGETEALSDLDPDNSFENAHVAERNKHDGNATSIARYLSVAEKDEH